MKWSLQQLRAAGREPFVFDEQLSLSSLKNENPEIRDVSLFHVKGRADLTGSLVTFTLRIKGELILPCSRTLADVHFPIDLHVTEKYYPAHEQLSARVEGDEDIHFFEGDMIDLLPAIRERILLEIPMQVYASSDAVPQAPESGEGWQIVTDEEKTKKIDPRLAGLAKFFEKE